MNRIQYPVISLISATILAIMASQSTHAGAFSLYTESSAAAIGNYAAGIAAEAADASTAWYNPAGLVLLKKQQIVLSGIGVLPSTQLTGTSTYAINGEPPFPPYSQSINNLEGAENGFVPAIHYALPLGDRAAFGLSVVAPFGLSTNWGTTSPVRYAATKTQLQTIDISPDIAGKLTDNLAFGAGIDVQWAKVNFNNVLGIPNLSLENPDLTATMLDSTSDNQGTSVGFGFHTGLIGTFNDNHTRIGVNYQSKISHIFDGSSTLTGPLADPALTNPMAVFGNNALFSNDITMPDMLTLSAYQDVNNKLALLGSAVYSGWSAFNSIQLDNVAAFSLAPPTPTTTLANISIPENYRNAWRFAVGANYHVNEKWMMRVGGGYDQTPTVTSARDIRLPDANRWALSIGTHYQPYPSIGLDVGYAWLFAANKSTVNNTLVFGPEVSYNVNALAKNHAQLVGAQIVWTV